MSANTRHRIRARRTLRGSDAAASAAIVGFTAAVAIYGLVFVAYVGLIQAPAGQHVEAPVLQSRATAGLDQLLTTPGKTSTGMAWFKDPDKITRFGLAQDGKVGYLDLDKMKNLTRGAMTKDGANALLDYAEAREALGIGDRFDFHLRSYPLLSGLNDLAQPIRGLRTAYIGDFDESNGATVTTAHALVDVTSYVLLNVTVTNTANVATVFQVDFSIALKNGVVTDSANTKQLAQSEKQNVTLKMYRTQKWDWGANTPKVNVTVNDPGGKVAEFDVSLSGIPTMTSGPVNGYAMVLVNADKLSFKTTEKPKLTYDVVQGDGKSKNGEALRIEVRWVGNNSLSEAFTPTTGGSNKVTMCCDQLAGEYNLTVELSADTSYNSIDRFMVTNDAGGGTIQTETAASASERAMVAYVVEQFTNTRYDANNGDVYPDIKAVMNNDMANNLSIDKYRIVVVGSQVDHQAMTSNAIKDNIKDWVFRGGLLVVLGSTDQNVNWLQPLFHASITTSGGGIGNPDPTHPLLHAPEELAYQRYKDAGKAWKYNSGSDEHFTHVLTRSAASNPEDVLAVSKSGHYGNGTVLLTTWTLYDLTAPQDDAEARKVLYNMLAQSLGSLFVDFGPNIPARAEVASSSRIATAPHPSVASEQVLTRMVLYVFR